MTQAAAISSGRVGGKNAGAAFCVFRGLNQGSGGSKGNRISAHLFSIVGTGRGSKIIRHRGGIPGLGLRPVVFRRQSDGRFN